ncbi:MAG: hypothetical protein DRJ50_06490 [Actinobacteria bacterium]|nr:MAG: hypothetical protein DRJ50_06490 [Actinomycetota bacterium]
MPVGRAPYSMIQEKLKANEISETDAALMTSIIESFVEDHVRGTTTGLVLDSEVYSAKGDTENPSATGLWGMDLLSTASTGQEAAANAVNRLVRSIARLFGTEGLLLGESGGGSLALSKDKSNQFGLIVDGSLVEISGQYEKDYLGPLAAMNGWAKEDLPKFKTEKLQHRELTEVTDALEGLAKAGAPIIQSDPAVNVVREAMGLPEQDMEAIELDSALRAAEGVQPGAVDDEGEEGEGERATANSETIGDEE